MRITIHAAAQAELMAAIDWYELKEPGLGQEFAVEVVDALDRICEYPRAWPVVDGEVRRCLTNRFPFGILYAVKDDDLIVLAVMHGHREPGYWRDRRQLGE